MDRIASAVARSPGVELLHRSADPDHNRLVLAYRGSPEPVLEATKALAEIVFAEIDVRTHRGEHPRVGALDVVPFIGGPEAHALDVCRAFGSWVGDAGVPVYYYEAAATSEERRSLPRIRSGQFEGLAAKMLEPSWRPDEGPGSPHPSAGCVVTGVRSPLVRFNVNLLAADASVARGIASRVRESGGGLPHVRALGIKLARRGLSQVSMNLTRYRATSVAQAYDRVWEEAARAETGIAGCELIGLVPREALQGLELTSLGLEVQNEQILDLVPGEVARAEVSRDDGVQDDAGPDDIEREGDA